MNEKPHICILTSQYFGWGIYGGFGSMSRKLAENLAKSGYPVTVIVPRRQDQKPLEEINGVKVRSFSALDVLGAIRLIRDTQADVFHSQDPTVLTFFAQQVHPKRIHLVTCRDPRNANDWWVEFCYATPRRRLLTPFNYMTESSFLVRRAVRNAHGVYCPAHFLKPKIRRMYGLAQDPTLLPNLIDVPDPLPSKSATPTITFLARWDKRKRPWLFLDLAKQFPEYRFIAVGQGSASAESDFDRELRSRYGGVPNLELPGFINRFKEPERIHRILSDTWVFVSTAAREGLPLTFLEAAAYGCSILSVVNPDDFATRFGAQVHNDDFASALRELLANSPLAKGQEAHAYVRGAYETSRALTAHEEQYARHLSHAR